MAQSGARDGRGPMPDPPWDVQVTMVPAPRGRGPGTRRLSAISATRVLYVVALVLAGVAALLVDAAPHRQAAAAMPREIAQPHVTRASGVAIAYRYPLGCLGASIPAGDLRAGGRRAVRSAPCWRYGVYVTAILVRSHKAWRLALEAISPACPHVSLPAAVLAQVVVCTRGHPGRGSGPA